MKLEGKQFLYDLSEDLRYHPLEALESITRRELGSLPKKMHRKLRKARKRARKLQKLINRMKGLGRSFADEVNPDQ